MDEISRELDINKKDIFTTASPNLFAVVVHNSWLTWFKNAEVSNCVEKELGLTLQPGESVPYPWRKIFIRVLRKKASKVLPLPRYKLNENIVETPLTFAQLLQYVSQSNQRNLWKESYKKYCQNNESIKESTIVSLLEHDQLVAEVILRLYGCHIIRVRSAGKFTYYKESTSKHVLKSYETHANLLAAMFVLETNNNYFIVYKGHYENNLLDCLNFSPNLIDKTYARGLFIVYQLLSVSKALSDRGLSLGTLKLQDIYMSEDLWLQIIPPITNNIHCIDPTLICEQNRNRHTSCQSLNSENTQKSGEEWCWRSDAVQLEKLCMLWVRGRISNLDYLLHLNVLAGRSANDPQAHFMVPWVTDFSSRCGRNWRDLSKSKYRLNKGDRQLDMTYDVLSCNGQIPHHVTDALSDITCYVYLARRTPKDTLCKYVRNKWVPAEYPASIQRMQEWTPDECIPEFYTDPTVFKSMHEDLPDLGIPSWATCVEDFITKHREALESTHVSENLHHWIDITFGYKMSGSAAVKAKNVCLSLVDGSSRTRRGAAVQLLGAPHPPRRLRAPPPAPPRLRWTAPRDAKKSARDSSDEVSDDEEESSSLPQHVSRLTVPVQRVRRHKSASRARSLCKGQEEDIPNSESRASSHSRHYRVQRSELGKDIIYLPKEFNPAASIQALEALDNFHTKCFFSKAEDKDKQKESVAKNPYPVPQETKENEHPSSSREALEETAFTNHMFLASYNQGYLKKFSQDSLEIRKDRKNRMFNTRDTTDAAVFKQFVTESRRQDMLVIGCLIVEIFLHTYMRPLRLSNENFQERYKSCRTILKYNFNSMPKCISYVASLLLNVEPPSLSLKNEITLSREEPTKNIIVTDKGLPPPTLSQLLQPLLMQHLIPFPQSFSVLYSLVSTIHEYELTNNELQILYTYECDGSQCEIYQNIDKTKLYFTQKIAEGKIQACINHLGILLNQVTNDNQFNVLDIFLQYYIQMLENKETSVLAAWHLFDVISKALGPSETNKKLLRHILNLYEDDEYVYDKSDQHKLTDVDAITSSGLASKQKYVKLYHHIFLLQLMVRLGLQCFLDNFTQHLVEAVGGYKDTVGTESGSPGHLCHNRATLSKKPRYSDDNLKNALINTSDMFSPDTSYGSEHVVTPNIDKSISDVNDVTKEKDHDSRSENELFHFENDKDRNPSRNSRSKSPTGSLDSNNKDSNLIPSPSSAAEYISPGNSRFFTNISSPNSKESSAIKDENQDTSSDSNKILPSPTVEIPRPMFTSYLHFAEDDQKSDSVESTNERLLRHIKSLDFTRKVANKVVNISLGNEEDNEREDKDNTEYKISDMSSESLIWLSHRLGPVLTCRYITRNLLKMLTLCYIGKENLAPWDGDEKDEFDEISIVNSKVVGDRNAMKVIKCLTSIVAMYGEHLIIFQYLPHMGELIASCRRRLSTPLEGGVVACLQLIKYLLPFISDVKVMEQLQDTFLKSILQPALRLASTARCAYPSGALARGALARKLLGALHAVALRVGPEMTRRHLCVPALQRFFLAFDKASGKTDNWPKQDENNLDKSSEQDSADSKLEGFLEICRDGSTAEWAIKDGRVVRSDIPELACTPPSLGDRHDVTTLSAQEELLMVFDEELAYHSYTTFAKLIGIDTLERCLKNSETIRALCSKYRQANSISSPLHTTRPDKRFQSSLSDEPLTRKTIDIPSRPDVVVDHISNSNSFGSNVTLVGNRIDVSNACESAGQVDGFDVVAYKTDAGNKSERHLRGDWLIYWEHEIGRADKDARFNLKQIKLQTFVGHSHSVKSIHCLDNENSFMSGSKDKTVRLWSLRNQGDGNAVTQCNWTYTGHKKGVLSLTFLESLRLAVSTDSVVHIWDPFMESVVCQLDGPRWQAAVSIVRALPGPASAVLAATTDATLRVLDARAPAHPHELKVVAGGASFIRCMCVSPSGAWACVGLASGALALLDVRTGGTRASWRAHDGEVLRLAAVDDHRVLSSGLDQVTALWRVDDGELIAHLKGSTEPVHCLSVYYNELISGTTNNRIGVHTSLDQDASFSSTKLRSDTFKGVLTCMSVLPLNRLLLLGSDNGTISLLC